MTMVVTAAQQGSGNRQDRAITRDPTAATAVLAECNTSFWSTRSHVNIFDHHPHFCLPGSEEFVRPQPKWI
jgi:hypothetical protein